MSSKLIDIYGCAKAAKPGLFKDSWAPITKRTQMAIIKKIGDRIIIPKAEAIKSNSRLAIRPQPVRAV